MGNVETAWQVALTLNLAPDLVCAVCEQESAWNEWAVRYEPSFLSRYVAPLYTAGKLSATEAYTRSMSWGLMQIMGQTARELGFGAPLPSLCDPQLGVKYGCLKLADCLKRLSGDTMRALEAYNGGSNPEYAAQVTARRARYLVQK